MERWPELMFEFDHKAKLINEALAFTGQANRATDRTCKAMELAVEVASEFDAGTVDSTHLLCSLMREGAGVAFHILDGLGLKQSRLEQAVASASGAGSDFDGASLLRLDDDLAVALNGCWTLATSLHHNYIGTEHLLLAIVRTETRARELLRLLEIDGATVDSQIRKLLRAAD